jgi:preprotein translocase subunit SecG
MTGLPLLAVAFIMKVIAGLFALCAAALVLIILIQKGRGTGLSGAFGGGLASGILGSKTGDFLTWATVSLAGVFLFLAGLMVKFYRPTVSAFDNPATQRQQPESAPQPEGTQPPTAGEKPTPTKTDVNLNE